MRRGLSYLEVLIAAGIALMGILGAIAIYPVAIMNLRKGQTVDVMAAIGPSALASKSALHVDDPLWWKMSVGGSLVDVENPAYASRADFQGRRIHPALQPYDALCFDPRFAASVTTWDATQNDPTLFPSVMPANALDARMRRLTLGSGLPGTPKPAMTTAQARLLFKCQDDLMFARPEQGDVINGIPLDSTSPAQQLLDPTGRRRDYYADFEFIYTALPKTEFSGGVFTATGDYDVSAVIFRERQPDVSKILTWSGDPSFIEEERVCDLTFLTPGFNGGDVTITLRPGRPEADLNTVQTSWALVSGVETVTDNRVSPPIVGQRPIFQWYRVSGFSSVYGNQRDLTLDGPDWPANASNLRCTLVSGVVGVFTERMQLK